MSSKEVREQISIFVDLPSGPPDKIIPYYLNLLPQIETNVDRSLERFTNNGYGIAVPDYLHDPLRYAVKTLGGKRARPLLVHLAHDLVGGQFPQIGEAAIIPELPHKGSLVEDDIDDNAVQRDGKLPVYKAFGQTEERGKEIAKATYEFLYTTPRFILNELDIDPQMRERLWKEYLYYADYTRSGQRLESLQNNAREYVHSEFDMWAAHLATLGKVQAFTYSVRVGAILGGGNAKQVSALSQVADQSAISFQIMDDLESMKPGSDDFGADITEGKMNLATYNAFILPKTRNRIREIYRMRTNDPEIIREAVTLMEENNIFVYAENKAGIHATLAIDILNKSFPPSDARELLTQTITLFLNRDLFPKDK